MKKVVKDKVAKKQNILNSYKILNLNGKQLYVIGISKILKFTAENVLLLLKNNQSLSVLGQDIIICESSPSSIMLGGKIIKVEVVS